MLNSLLPHPSVTSLLFDRHSDFGAWKASRKESVKPVVEMQQVHGAQVAIIDDPQAERVPNVDGILTTNPDLHLVVRTADCLPILLYHPQGVVGALHAGRKGTELKILQKTLQLVKAQFNLTQDLQIWFGPAICRDCYQIDRETDLHYDLIEQNIRQLRAEFPEDAAHLTIFDHCTLCENNQFFSYRKEGAGVGMNYSVIGLG